MAQPRVELESPEVITRTVAVPEVMPTSPEELEHFVQIVAGNLAISIMQTMEAQMRGEAVHLGQATTHRVSVTRPGKVALTCLVCEQPITPQQARWQAEAEAICRDCWPAALPIARTQAPEAAAPVPRALPRCPRCGGAMLRDGDGELCCSVCGEITYAVPAVA